MKNLNLLFYKTYYNDVLSEKFSEAVKKNNNEIYNAVFDHDKDYEKSPIATHTMIFKTAYPGLLIGTGISHGSGLCDDDINCGFSLDYVTGQPIISGSSVKGALRRHFKNSPEVIAELTGLDINKVRELEKELFEGKDQYLDAVIFDGDKNGLILGKESITPHSSVSKNPVPILLIKVLPGVRFEFRFVLNDGILTAGDKKQLFAKLIELFGVGAKTNVGYGILHESDDKISPKAKKEQDIVPANSVENTSSERINCKHCGKSNFKYYQDGNLRKKCWICKKPL